MEKQKNSIAIQWQIRAALFCMVVLLCPGTAFAATYTLPADFGSNPFSDCSGSGSSYTCTDNVEIGQTKSVEITQNISLEIQGNFELQKNVEINANGYTFDVTVTGNFIVDKDCNLEVNISANGNVEINKNIIFTGNITANGNVDIDKDGEVYGDIDSNGNITLGNNTTVYGTCSPDHPQCEDAAVTCPTENGCPPIWSYHIDQKNTGLSSSPGPQDATVKWTYTTGNKIERSSAAIGNDGTIYVGSKDKKLYAINPDGSLKWSYTSGGEIKSSPAIGYDGTIYFGAKDKKLYALNPDDGSLKWTYTTGGAIDYSSPAVDDNGIVYIGTNDNKLYAVSLSGTLNWSYTTGGDVKSTAAIADDGTIYFGSKDDKLYALNSDGSLKWAYTTGGAIEKSSPAIGSDGTIYVGSKDDKLYAINPNGTLKWTYQTGGDVKSSPAIGSDGTIYVGSKDDKLHAVNSDGSAKWSYTTGHDVEETSAAIGSDGTIYVGSKDKKIYAINSDGTLKWSYTTGDDIKSSPVIDSNGILYIGSKDNKLYAFQQITPIAEYQFDECFWDGTSGEVTDSSGNGYNGTAVNGPATSRDTPAVGDASTGSCGYGVFDDINDYIDLSGLPNLVNDFTITAWIKATSIEGDQRIFVDDENNSGGFAFSLGDGGNGKLRFFSRNVAPVILDTSTAVITANTWYFVSAVHDAINKTRKIYVNGSEAASGTYSGTWGSDAGIASIGGETDNAGGEGVASWRFGGNIDEVHVYTSALSASEINSVYNDSGHTCPTCVAVDHYEIHHDGSALTCEPETVTVKACANADCSSLYTSAATVTLSPTGWAGGNSKIFTGSAAYKLRHTTAESVTLGISSANPNASVTCFENGSSGACTIIFHDAGFVFDVPIQIACKTSSTVTIKAVRKDDDTELCIPAFANRTENINFWSTYVNPATGTQSVTINSTAVATSSPGTAVSLTFDGSGKSTFTVSYPDAGSMRLDTSFNGTGDEDGTVDEAGLVMIGNDTFVSRPAGLCVYSDDANADCSSGDAACSAFTQAGQPFNLKVKGVCWAADGEADTDFCDNSVTANFELAGITVSRNIIAPAAGSSGTLGISSFDMASGDNGEHTIIQTISEVGVFTFSADPPAYLGVGDVIPTSTSSNIGRFIPARFTVSSNTPLFDNVCGSGSFTYLGQEFGFATDTDPIITVTALNTSGTTTNNYGGSFWKLTGVLNNRSYSNAAATSATLTRTTDGGNVTPADTGNYDGDGTLTITGDQLTYSKPYAPEAPFNASVHLTLTAADLTDSDSVCYDFNTDSTCDSYQISGMTGTNLRWGRLNIQNNFGPETEDLSLSLTVQYFDGSGFSTHLDDGCSQVGLSFSNYTDNLNSGETCVQDNGSPGKSGEGCAATGPVAEQFEEPPLLGDFNIYLLAPGTGNNGSVGVTGAEESGGTWLQYDWDNDSSHDDDPTATATFGIYRGNDRIINWIEIVR